MANSLSAQKFLNTEEASAVRIELDGLMTNPDFNTESTYSPASVEMVTFTEKHMKYLSLHPTLNHRHYISNLKLKTRIR
jgi:hypothetical protein